MPDLVETMVYTIERGVPWHTKGNPVSGLMTWGEACPAAGLDWPVAVEAVQTALGEPIDFKRAVVRQTDRRVLGVVGTDYQPVQNEDVFQFADAIVADGGAHFETAGSLDHGRTIFASMDLTAVEPITVGGDPSPVKGFLVLSNSHDGSSALKGTVTPVRVVCANTLNLAFRGAKGVFYVRHTGNIESKLAAARKALDLSVDYMARFAEAAGAFTEVEVTNERAEAILRDAFGMTEAMEEKGTDSGWFQKHNATRALETYLTVPDLDPIRGTGWGLLNGTAQYLDHERAYGRASNGRADDVKMSSILWGASADVLNRTAALISPEAAALLDPKVVKAAKAAATRS